MDRADHHVIDRFQVTLPLDPRTHPPLQRPTVFRFLTEDLRLQGPVTVLSFAGLPGLHGVAVRGTSGRGLRLPVWPHHENRKRAPCHWWRKVRQRPEQYLSVEKTL